VFQEWPLKVQEKQALTEPFARGWRSMCISKSLGAMFLRSCFL
jgi:hypothetical protein